MISADTLIRGGTLVLPDGEQRADLLVKDGRIGGIVAAGTPVEARETLDIDGKHVLPGVIDIHFHVRAPAYPERGTVESETRAALAGGVTTIFEMPISKPCCATPEIFRERRDHFAPRAHVNFALYGAPGRLQAEEVDGMAGEGAIAFKIFMTGAPVGRDDEFEGLSLPATGGQYEALRLVGRTGRPLVAHAEDNDLLEHFTKRLRDSGRTDPATHGESRPPVVEAAAIARLLELNRDVGASVHIAHVTSRRALDVIRLYKATGMDLTAETCPQYLQFDASMVDEHGPFAKINPPLRSPDDREALWEGIRDGTLMSVTTDHSPFTKAEKERGDIWSAPPGAPGVEHLLVGMLDAAARGRVSLPQVARLLATHGAERFGIASRKGSIRPGADADLVVVDLNAVTRTRREDLLTASRETDRFYAEREYRGAVELTMLMGRVAYRDGAILNRAGDGEFVTPTD